jgi:basic membrane protein A
MTRICENARTTTTTISPRLTPVLIKSLNRTENVNEPPHAGVDRGPSECEDHTMRRAIAKATLVTVVAAALAACAAADTTSDPSKVRVAMVSDLGGLGDRSFNDSAYAGLRAAKHDFGDEIAVLQSTSGAEYKTNLHDLAAAGYDEIIAIGFLMQQDITDAARVYPNKHFAIIDAVVDAPNVASVTFREEQGSFLAGAAAALASKTHHLAFIGGVDIPLLRKFEVGFTAGAREIDPSVKVDVRYVGSFDDEGAGKRLGAGLYDAGADVIFVAAGRANLGAIEAVKARPGKFVIGVDSDEDGIAPGRVLTSMLKHVDKAVIALASQVTKTSAPTGHVVLGLKQDGVGLTDFRYTRSTMTPPRRARIKAIAAAIVAGTIVPPTTREELAAFRPVPLGN